MAAFKKFRIDNKYSHLDSTSISLEGEYKICQTDCEENLEPIPIKIVHGYSKNKRPDLKQFLINLIVSGDGGVPLDDFVASLTPLQAAIESERVEIAQILIEAGADVNTKTIGELEVTYSQR